MDSYVIKIKKRFGWSKYVVTNHFIRSSAKAFNSDLESLDLPIIPWLVLILIDNSMVIIPDIEHKEHMIIGKKIKQDDLEKITEKEEWHNGVQTAEA